MHMREYETRAWSDGFDGYGMHGERNKVWVGWSVKNMWCREKDMVGAMHGHARSCNQHLVFH